MERHTIFLLTKRGKSREHLDDFFAKTCSNKLLVILGCSHPECLGIYIKRKEI